MAYGEELLNDPVAWGRRLIETEDHDPLYGTLTRAQSKGLMDTRQLHRWLLAYWCCYHPGAASWLSEHKGLDFWRWMHTAAENVIDPGKVGIPVEGRWPRAGERRHWRGQKAIDQVVGFSKEFPDNPEEITRRMTLLDTEGHVTLKDIETEVLKWPQFGPWIAFKIADMAERVLGRDVKFPVDITRLYKDPREGAEMAGPIMRMGSAAVPGALVFFYKDMVVAGATPRRVNVQEAETVLCKWKSARKGHYFIGKDTNHYHETMVGWGDTSEALRRCLPPEIGLK